MTQDEQARLDNDFMYHPPYGDQGDRYTGIRYRAKLLASFIMDTCPNSRERSVALTKVDEVVFWANASIARSG